MEPDQLWTEYISKKDPLIKEALIIHYVCLVKKIANKMSYSLPQYALKDDLYSYGVFGLFEAIDRYNPELKIPFEVFASKRIKGSIIDGLRKEDWFPTSLRKKAKLIENAYCKLEMQLGRSATDEEVAAELNIDPDELSKWLKNTQYIAVFSLDEPLSDDNEGLLIENLQDSESPEPSDVVEEKEIKALLAKVVEELPEKEKLIISLFYYHDLTNKEIAKVMELSESRISQLHTKAVFRMRGKLSRYKKFLK